MVTLVYPDDLLLTAGSAELGNRGPGALISTSKTTGGSSRLLSFSHFPHRYNHADPLPGSRGRKATQGPTELRCKACTSLWKTIT